MSATNDYGTYIRKYSNSPDEDEWLFVTGSKLEIIEDEQWI